MCVCVGGRGGGVPALISTIGNFLDIHGIIHGGKGITCCHGNSIIFDAMLRQTLLYLVVFSKCQRNNSIK